MTSSAKTPRRAFEGPTFSALKCPRNGGLENSCELPFGFVWTPMAPCNEEAVAIVECPTDALPPVLCLTCLAYMNPNCKLDPRTGVWNCPLCDQENVAPVREFKEGQLLHQVLKSPIVEYHQPMLEPKPLGPEEPDDSCTYIFVVDANLPAEDAHAIVTAVESFVAENPKENPKVKLGLVVFDDTVLMYQLGLSGVASADIYTPMDAAQEDVEALIARKAMLDSRAYLMQDVDPDHSLDNLRRCISAVFGVPVQKSSADTEKPMSRQEMLQRQKETRMRKEQVKQHHHQNGSADDNKTPIESPWVKHRQESKSKHPKRSTGEAIQCALDLTGVGSHPSRTSRILLFTNGCCNSGEFSVVAPADESTAIAKRRNKKHNVDFVDTNALAKAVEYFDMTANFALETGVGIDVLCTGNPFLVRLSG